jgi:hypothetical protein
MRIPDRWRYCNANDLESPSNGVVCELSDGPLLVRLEDTVEILEDTVEINGQMDRAAAGLAGQKSNWHSSDRPREFFRGRSLGVPDLGLSSREESHHPSSSFSQRLGLCPDR